MSVKYTSVEVSLDDDSVLKIGNFLIRKVGESSITVYHLRDGFDIEKDSISKLSSTNFTNILSDGKKTDPKDFMDGFFLNVGYGELVRGRGTVIPPTDMIVSAGQNGIQSSPIFEDTVLPTKP